MTQNLRQKEEQRQLEKESLKVQVISKTNKRKGLCLDCIRSESCILSHNTEEAIWTCEDYENEEAGETSDQQVYMNTAVKEAVKATAEETNPGLCAYCAYKETCSLKKIDGGIWHCEEYA